MEDMRSFSVENLRRRITKINRERGGGGGGGEGVRQEGQCCQDIGSIFRTLEAYISIITSLCPHPTNPLPLHHITHATKNDRFVLDIQSQARGECHHIMVKHTKPQNNKTSLARRRHNSSKFSQRRIRYFVHVAAHTLHVQDDWEKRY